MEGVQPYRKVGLILLTVKGMVTDFGEDMHCQFLEIIRILVDSYTMSGSQRDTIIEIFYEKHLDQLIDVIASSCPSKSNQSAVGKSPGIGRRDESHTATKPEILSNICELLCFCVIHHPYRIKCNFLMNNAIEKVLSLTRRREKFLVVAAVRFVRTIISRNDDHLLRHMVKNNLLKPVIEAFIENGNRYNMLHSAVLELLEYIRKDNFTKPLVIYIVDNFWDQLIKFENLGSIQAFKVKYEQLLENHETKGSSTMTEARKKTDERGLGKEEEDYFNEDSDEEDSAGHVPHARNQNPRSSLSNGTKVNSTSLRAGSGSGGLVDYDDDDDDDDYNPPPRKPESSLEDEPLNLSKIKRRSADGKHEELKVAKKPKIEVRISDAKVVVAAPSSSSNDSELQSKYTPSPASTAQTPETNGDLEKETEGPKICQTPLEDADNRESVGGESATTLSNSSPERVVNASNGSEPYSVR